MRGTTALIAFFFIQTFLVGCRSLAPEGEAGAEPVISIYNSENGIVTRPADLRLDVGSGVVFMNHTTYDLTLAFDFGKGTARVVQRILPFSSSTRIAAVQPGEIHYTLYFTSAKNFGQTSGIVTVGEGVPKEERPEKKPPAPEPNPSEPVII
ncbi:MAG TPA: hypothetical protein VFG95_09635 [Nitrospiria bacterium]|nr:hypothetical protein [Nitrospiria bacterium]